MSESPRIVAAGWYEDPSDAASVRWWNGIAWTDNHRPKPESGAATLAAPVEAVSASADHGPAPSSASISDPTTSSSTLLSFSPLVFLAAGVVAAWLWVSGRSAIGATAFLVAFVLCVLWAVLDSRALRSAGRRPVSWLWSLLGPLVYLVARGVRMRTWMPALICLGLFAAIGAGAGVLWSLGVGASVEFAERVQQEVGDGLVGSGAATSVVCPALIEERGVGSTHACDATLPDGSVRSVIVSVDSDQGALSYTLR
ncbi:DUF2510 domain-containing protein [Salinibacterium sp. ZJ77]|uniref:DUF2510 domain-containing protein n=1 Tax=Salinibacterium sp. ZJ77 TaxID=2708337 RepID=UPI0014233BC8|nr:DUF2510 domain-containing protein [Salinibacterium sp. ZJ77]